MPCYFLYCDLSSVITIIHKMQSHPPFPAVNYFYSQTIFLKHDFRKKLLLHISGMEPYVVYVKVLRACGHNTFFG